MSDNTLLKKDKISVNRKFMFTLVAGVFALGIFLGSALSMFSPLSGGKSETVSGRAEGTFKFIKASIESKAPDGTSLNKELKPFKYKINTLIETALKNHDAATVSVSFRDLNTGNRFSIGGNEKFLSESQWKLPLMIAYFKWAESNPLVLRKTITYTGRESTIDRDSPFPGKEIDPENSYTVNDLIYRMIVNNDAAAYTLLQKNLPSTRFEKILKDLDVEYDPNKKEDSLSLNSFAAFYRVLFNASYLSEEMSEKALRYLSQSSFRDGMASGIPQNISIACKHGGRLVTVTTDDKEQKFYQIYEFGIVYHPNRPFLLGIMVRGNNVDAIIKIIRDITHLTYNEIDQQV